MKDKRREHWMKNNDSVNVEKYHGGECSIFLRKIGAAP